jgi:hypothetical protein
MLTRQNRLGQVVDRPRRRRWAGIQGPKPENQAGKQTGNERNGALCGAHFTRMAPTCDMEGCDTHKQ